MTDELTSRDALPSWSMALANGGEVRVAPSELVVGCITVSVRVGDVRSVMFLTVDEAHAIKDIIDDAMAALDAPRHPGRE